MELKTIQRDGRPEEITVHPDRKDGVLTGVVRSPRGVDFFEMAGRGILLHNTSVELVELVKNDPKKAKEEIFRQHAERSNAFFLQNGIEGTIYETLDCEQDPVRGRRLALDSFNEYAPHPTD